MGPARPPRNSDARHSEPRPYDGRAGLSWHAEWMDAYTDSYRLFPLWAVLSLTIPVGLGAWGISAARYADTLAGTPLFALFAYGLAIGYINRQTIRVTAEGVAKTFGPLPCGVQPEWVPREEIAKVYLRYVYVSAKSGRAPYWAAGIEDSGGRWVDLTDPLAPPESVKQSAQHIAAMLGWTEQIDVRRGMPAVYDRKALAPLLLWGGLVVAAFGWGLLQSI